MDIAIHSRIKTLVHRGIRGKFRVQYNLVKGSKVEFIPSFFVGPVKTVVRLTSAPVPLNVGIPTLYTPGFFTRSHPW